MRKPAKTPRDYQGADAKKILAKLAKKQRALYVMAGGGGKTRTAAEVILQYVRAAFRCRGCYSLPEKTWSALCRPPRSASV